MGRRTQVIMYLNTNVLSQQLRVCATKRVFCRDKSMFVVKRVLSRQIVFVVTFIFLSRKTVFHDKYLSRNIYLLNIILSRQAYFCRVKRCVLLWQTHVCRDKQVFVATKLDTYCSSSPMINNSQSMGRGIWVIMYVNIFWDSSCNVCQHIRRLWCVGLESQCIHVSTIFCDSGCKVCEHHVGYGAWDPNCIFEQYAENGA